VSRLAIFCGEILVSNYLQLLKRSLALGCVWLSLTLLHSASTSANTTKVDVKICLGDGSEWAPFTHWERNADGSINRDKLTGAATEVILAVLTQLQLSYSIEYMPWARVQAEMATYDVAKKCDMTWDASFKEERFEKYYYSPPLYRTHLGVFYSNEKFNGSPPIRGLEDLEHFQLCGVTGFNYDKYNLKVAPDRVNTVEQALKLIEGKRCDLFPSEIETIYGGVAVGAFSFPSDVKSMRIPGLYKTFYAIFAKKSPTVDRILIPFNQTLIRLQAIGETERLFKRYLPEGSGL
jgi:polar amino acid transport system substrate-binding protein